MRRQTLNPGMPVDTFIRVFWKEPKEMVFCTWTCSCGLTYCIGNTMPCTRKQIWHQLGLYVYDYFGDFSNLLLDRSVKGIKSKGLYVSVGENQLT